MEAGGWFGYPYAGIAWRFHKDIEEGRCIRAEKYERQNEKIEAIELDIDEL